MTYYDDVYLSSPNEPAIPEAKHYNAALQKLMRDADIEQAYLSTEGSESLDYEAWVNEHYEDRVNYLANELAQKEQDER